MSNPSGSYYTSIGVGVATVSTNENAENGSRAVSLIFPKDVPVYPDDPHHEENFEEVFMSISAAKSLLIDLNDAVNAAISGAEEW